jgi:hypothetical protein
MPRSNFPQMPSIVPFQSVFVWIVIDSLFYIDPAMHICQFVIISALIQMSVR